MIQKIGQVFQLPGVIIRKPIVFTDKAEQSEELVEKLSCVEADSTVRNVRFQIGADAERKMLYDDGR